MSRCVIIGGGLGGLALAVRLAARGQSVTLCEQGPTFGGKMNRWIADGYTFDTGPSLITMPWVFRETFQAAGARLEDYIELERLEPVAEYIYPDGTRFQHSTNLPAWLETVRQLEPRDVDGFLRWLKLGARLYELSNETFLRRAASEPPDWRTLKALRHLPLRFAWGNYDKAVRAHFRSPHLRQLFNRYPTYVGSSPFRSSATLLVIPFIEYAFGGWYVKGGLYRIVEALAGLARGLGVDLRANAAVERIETGGGRVRGVVLADGARIEADVVTMNGDASLIGRLLGGGGASELPPAQRSMSGFLSLLGTRNTLHGTHHHTVCFSADYAREFRQIFEEQRFPEDPTVYVNAPSRSDRGLTPGEGETLFVMANTPARDEGWDEAATERAFARVQARLQASGFPALDIALRDHWTPARIARAYRMPGGAIYGSDSHGWRRAFMRPANRQKAARGLYLVGGSSHPGGGTPTVLLSSRITAELIGKYENA